MIDPIVELIYYGEVVAYMREQLDTDPRDPREWSDGDKLRLLADLFDAADLARGTTDRDVQNDLRRMAERLEAVDRP